MLTLLLVIPLMGSLIIMPIKEETADESARSKIKQIGLLTSLLTLAISILLWLQFDASESNYQFTSSPLLNSASPVASAGSNITEDSPSEGGATGIPLCTTS